MTENLVYSLSTLDARMLHCCEAASDPHVSDNSMLLTNFLAVSNRRSLMNVGIAAGGHRFLGHNQEGVPRVDLVYLAIFSISTRGHMWALRIVSRHTYSKPGKDRTENTKRICTFDCICPSCK
jgi:hypothetical protein